LPFGPTRVIHVIAVITAQGDPMISTIEQVETAPEAKAAKKATASARRARQG
jgi:hypothetical protein